MEIWMYYSFDLFMKLYNNHTVIIFSNGLPLSSIVKSQSNISSVNECLDVLIFPLCFVRYVDWQRLGLWTYRTLWHVWKRASVWRLGVSYTMYGSFRVQVLNWKLFPQGWDTRTNSGSHGIVDMRLYDGEAELQKELCSSDAAMSVVGALPSSLRLSHVWNVG